MATYHLNAKIISRGKGQSAIAAAAYRSGERLRDEQANEQKFYQARAERILFTAIMAPKDAPEWAYDRNQLWNHAERAEKRKDAQLAREIEISLPHELTEQQRELLVKDFAREAFVRKGYAVDIAIHAPDKDSDERNHHAHLMVTRRTLGPEGFAATKDWQFDKKQLGAWREQWAHLANRHLERHGHEARIDHRSHQARGIDQEPTVHVGYAANEMAARGAQSDRMDELRGILDRNDIRLEMKGIDGELKELERAEKSEQFAKESINQAAKLPSPVPALSRAAHAPLTVLDAATGQIEKLAEFVLDFLGGGSNPMGKNRANFLPDEQRESREIMALISIRESMERGESLSASDLRRLAPSHLDNIRLRGDDAVRQMVDDAREQADRSRKEAEWGRDPADRTR